MPDRIIHASGRTSETLDVLSDGAERFFWRLTTVADDYGRFRADPRILKAECFPLKVDLLATATVAGWFTELCAGPDPLVHTYVVNDTRYGVFCKWFERQRKRDSKPKYPAPPEVDAAPADGGDSPQLAAARGDSPQLAAARGDSPQLAATRGNLPLARARSGSRESRVGSRDPTLTQERRYDEWTLPLVRIWQEATGGWPEPIPFLRALEAIRARPPTAVLAHALTAYLTREKPEFVRFETFCAKWKLYTEDGGVAAAAPRGPQDETQRVQLAAAKAVSM